MIQTSRIKALNAQKIKKGRYVVYWMQASHRTHYNQALEYAVRMANENEIPVVVYFELIDGYPEANSRHYIFMLEGLAHVGEELKKEGMKFVINRRSRGIHTNLFQLAEDAVMVITDRGYLRLQKKWRESVGRQLSCPLIQVESDVVVPVETASFKEEFSAGTFRPRINRHLKNYMKSIRHQKPERSSLKFSFKTLKLSADKIHSFAASLAVDGSVSPSPFFRGGTNEAMRRLRIFLAKKLDHFENLRNDPSKNFLSELSPYLHFGQISSLYVGLQAAKAKSPGRESFLEELIVRRELAANFVHYNSRYDSYDCLPPWTKRTLQDHNRDKREWLYSSEKLERASTHDPYWNAAQEEMVLTGKMHGYMRMYWGKKILEWTRSHKEGFEIALYLNNKYNLDGRDPNGYAGVAWCFGKHDRAWSERNIFGKVRYMNADGLRRKFDMQAYVDKIENLKIEIKKNALFQFKNRRVE